jgi:hypothetical protein
MRFALRLAILALLLPLSAQAGAPRAAQAPGGAAGPAVHPTAPAADCLVEVPIGCPPEPPEGVCHQRIIITVIDPTTGAAIPDADVTVAVPAAGIIVGSTTDKAGLAVIEIELPCGVQGVAEVSVISNGIPCSVDAVALGGICMAPTPVLKRSWGRLKVIYR